MAKTEQRYNGRPWLSEQEILSIRLRNKGNEDIERLLEFIRPQKDPCV
jgi:hypothetical protein